MKFSSWSPLASSDQVGNLSIFLKNLALLGCWDLVAHPVMQVIGEQALVDILDLSEVAWTCWVFLHPAVGWG